MGVSRLTRVSRVTSPARQEWDNSSIRNERVLLAQAALKGRNENAYENIESILDVKFGEAGVALMPRVSLIQDS